MIRGSHILSGVWTDQITFVFGSLSFFHNHPFSRRFFINLIRDFAVLIESETCMFVNDAVNGGYQPLKISFAADPTAEKHQSRTWESHIYCSKTAARNICQGLGFCVRRQFFYVLICRGMQIIIHVRYRSTYFLHQQIIVDF